MIGGPVQRTRPGWSVKDHVSQVTKWDRAVIELLRTGAPMQETLGISDPPGLRVVGIR